MASNATTSSLGRILQLFLLVSLVQTVAADYYVYVYWYFWVGLLVVCGALILGGAFFRMWYAKRSPSRTVVSPARVQSTTVNVVASPSQPMPQQPPYQPQPLPPPYQQYPQPYQDPAYPPNMGASGPPPVGDPFKQATYG